MGALGVWLATDEAGSLLVQLGAALKRPYESDLLDDNPELTSMVTDRLGRFHFDFPTEDFADFIERLIEAIDEEGEATA